MKTTKIISTITIILTVTVIIFIALFIWTMSIMGDPSSHINYYLHNDTKDTLYILENEIDTHKNNYETDSLGRIKVSPQTDILFYKKMIIGLVNEYNIDKLQANGDSMTIFNALGHFKISLADKTKYKTKLEDRQTFNFYRIISQTEIK